MCFCLQISFLRDLFRWETEDSSRNHPK
jgi:hypothetical protein